MAEKKKPLIRIEHVSIKNYKGIDSLEIDFPSPLMDGDPDVFVMGSENGLGKTSVLECCSLLLLTLALGEKQINYNFHYTKRYFGINLNDLLVKSDAKECEIDGRIYLGADLFRVRISVQRTGDITTEIKILNKKSTSKTAEKLLYKKKLFDSDIEHDEDELVPIIFGLSSNSFVAPPVLLFHSYRKTQEGNPDLGMMIREDSRARRSIMRRHGYGEQTVVSVFKMIILRSLMREAKLFEMEDKKDHGGAMDELNNLIKTYAGGTIKKLRPSADNKMDFRIQRDNQKNGHTFSFDGLSSGQKEIISTLFLIWHQTKNFPSVVFIDEPELHLNAQWHRQFIKDLTEISPDNQYIIATHSEYVMDFVESRQRVLLAKN